MVRITRWLYFVDPFSQDEDDKAAYVRGSYTSQSILCVEVSSHASCGAAKVAMQVTCNKNHYMQSSQALQQLRHNATVLFYFI
ncbi:hypothetical protein ES288_D10G017900v1 [Gossypium darwinii]|uniref:Uncharacterized protein n=1 Tax=Gossypium darwinii TaxID=34276 RepID=A0A5D2AYW7_GOSDA|nr:hypothetical protein ES288_D10G017900v1 [Gossypium darwinii]